MKIPLWRRRRRDEDLDEELRSHLAMATHDRIERGEAAEQARNSALREFGNVALVIEATRETWGWTWLENLVRDLRHGLRAMRRSPGITAVALLSLALGIGANTAIFSLIDQLLLRSLPVRHPEQLFKLVITGPPGFVGTYGLVETFPFREFELFRRRAQSFSGLLFSPNLHISREITIDGAPETVRAIPVPGTYFTALGVNPFHGRLVAPEDESSAVAVISYGFWKRRFGRDASVLGKAFTFHRTSFSIVGFDITPGESGGTADRAVFTIIGVAPPEFSGMEAGFRPDIFVPVRVFSSSRPDDVLLRTGGWLQAIGRLKPGVRLEQAAAELTALRRPQLDREVPACITARE